MRRQARRKHHEKSLRLLPRQIWHGATSLGIQSFLLTQMCRSSQNLASRRSSQAQGLVRLFVVSQLERNALCRRTIIGLEQSHFAHARSFDLQLFRAPSSAASVMILRSGRRAPRSGGRPASSCTCRGPQFRACPAFFLDCLLP